MKRKTRTLFGTFLTITACTLAFSACGDEEAETPPQAEPKISYYVVGSVKGVDGAALPGITVSVKEDYMNFLGYVLLGSAQTDDQGLYRTRLFTDAKLHDGLVVIAEDPRGVFLSDTLDLTTLPKKKVLAGDDMMDSGTWELTGDFALQLHR